MKISKLAAGALVTLVAVVGAADAKEFKSTAYFAWYATGPAFEIEPGHYYFVGSFAGVVHYDDDGHPLQNASAICPGWTNIGIPGGGGYCVDTDADGDKLFLKWECTEALTPPKGAIDAGKCATVVTGGTGKYVGATGGNSFTGVTLAPFGDGTTAGYSLITDDVLTIKD